MILQGVSVFSFHETCLAEEENRLTFGFKRKPSDFESAILLRKSCVMSCHQSFREAQLYVRNSKDIFYLYCGN